MNDAFSAEEVGGFEIGPGEAVLGAGVADGADFGIFHETEVGDDAPEAVGEGLEGDALFEGNVG